MADSKAQALVVIREKSNAVYSLTRMYLLGTAAPEQEAWALNQIITETKAIIAACEAIVAEVDHAGR